MVVSSMNIYQNNVKKTGVKDEWELPKQMLSLPKCTFGDVPGENKRDWTQGLSQMVQCYTWQRGRKITSSPASFVIVINQKDIQTHKELKWVILEVEWRHVKTESKNLSMATTLGPDTWDHEKKWGEGKQTRNDKEKLFLLYLKTTNVLLITKVVWDTVCGGVIGVLWIWKLIPYSYKPQFCVIF